MLHDVVDDPAEYDEAALLATHAEQLADVIEAVGVEAAAEAAGESVETLAVVADGNGEAAGDLDVEAAAAVLALADGAPDAGTIAAEARDALLFGMTAGVLNVDVVARDVADDVEPGEVHGMLEGRHPMTLRQYVALQRVIEDRTP